MDALTIGIDANFLLKQKNVSSEDNDPGLGNGIAYVVDPVLYATHLKEHKNENKPVGGSFEALLG